MKDATGESVSVRVLGQADAPSRSWSACPRRARWPTGRLTACPAGEAEFGASGKVISFHGFLKAYVEGSDDPDAELDDNQRRLPPLAEREPLRALNLRAGRARDPAAGQVHRGHAHQGA